MKKLLGILILGLFLIVPSQADDIRDFQIEGISVGDSLLDYFDKKKIKKVLYPKSKKFARTYHIIKMQKFMMEFDFTTRPKIKNL